MRRREGLKIECTHPDHVGPRMLPLGWFGRDRGGRHSHCRVCRRAGKSAAEARRRSRMVGTVTQADIQAKWVLQRGLCAICHRWMTEYEVDHRKPLAKGGRHEVRNIQLTHPRCNRLKAARY